MIGALTKTYLLKYCKLPWLNLRDVLYLHKILKLLFLFVFVEITDPQVDVVCNDMHLITFLVIYVVK